MRYAKQYRGWVQIQNAQPETKSRIKRKSETARCKIALTCLALPLYQRFFLCRNAKKYTGYCIITCVPMWLRGKDSNQRPPGYGFAPPCGARKTVRAYAFPPVFRPLRIRRHRFICRRQRDAVLSQRAPLVGLITRRTRAQSHPRRRMKKTPVRWTGVFFMWLRGKDSNQRPPGYEPDELPAALPRDMICCVVSLDILPQGSSEVKRKYLFFAFRLCWFFRSVCRGGQASAPGVSEASGAASSSGSASSCCSPSCPDS